MKISILILFIITCFFSCDKDCNNTDDLVGKKFVHLFVPTEAECIASQSDPNFFINCHQDIRFLDESTATIILSDILNDVSYTVNGDKITIYSSTHSEFSENIIFTKKSKSSLQKDDDQTIWVEKNGSIWD
ncbi:MAG: hypothetical protein JKY03_05700 [Aureispira sp.]|nr:hypothetical protein [Aureispira sp.]